MAEAAFSENGKYYSAISKDGRLRIWDTETNVLKQEYTPDLHLTSPPTCLQWITVTQSLGTQKEGKRKSNNIEATQCIALGTSSGKILLYLVTQAKVETVLEEKSNEIQRFSIRALDWHPKCGLYSCNKENVVCEWDLENAAVTNKYNLNVENKSKQGNKICAIKIVPHTQKTKHRYLVSASWQVRLWSLHDGEATVVKNLGHSASPNAILMLASLKNVFWLIEGSQNERLLSFYDLSLTEDLPNGEDTPRKQRKKSLTTQPTYNFVLEDAPRMVDVQVQEEGTGTQLRIAAVTRSGVLHYYEHLLNGSSAKPIKPTVTVQASTAAASPLPLQCCRLPPARSRLLLGYTSGAALVFENITPDLKTKTQVLIRGDTRKQRLKKNTDVTKVRTDEQSNVGVSFVEPMGGVVGNVNRKRATPGDKVEVPMEARLANLALDVKSRSQSAVNQNLTKLLIQGLHSKDKGIILTVVQRDEGRAAGPTVAALPAHCVGPLLEHLADMAARRTSQCALVCTWLKAVLRSHSALLLAAPSPHLSQLLSIFTHRRSHLCQLLNLKGRLELTSSQRERPEAEEDQEPVLTYNDASSDEESALEAYASDSGSAQSWGAAPDDDQRDVDMESDVN